MIYIEYPWKNHSVSLGLGNAAVILCNLVGIPYGNINIKFLLGFSYWNTKETIHFCSVQNFSTY